MQCNLKTDTSRYARQIILSEVGAEGQQRLKDSKVLVVGAGGWAARYSCTWPVLASGR
ncbi:ThiF family adenylyltransferase [Pseudomonas sp. 10S4]|nr:ThiF family adenylyltransferase [Pseudomonas sp. 10S4]WPX21614.1 ThiF family adenylyltransferase [Pseudomonas sp. 10S4]